MPGPDCLELMEVAQGLLKIVEFQRRLDHNNGGPCCEWHLIGCHFSHKTFHFLEIPSGEVHVQENFVGALVRLQIYRRQDFHDFFP